MIISWTGSFPLFPPVAVPQGTTQFIGFEHDGVITPFLTFTTDNAPIEGSWSLIQDGVAFYGGPEPEVEDNLIYGFEGFTMPVGSYGGQPDFSVSLYGERTREGTIEPASFNGLNYVRYSAAVPEPSGFLLILIPVFILLFHRSTRS